MYQKTKWYPNESDMRIVRSILAMTKRKSSRSRNVLIKRIFKSGVIRSRYARCVIEADRSLKGELIMAATGSFDRQYFTVTNSLNVVRDKTTIGVNA